MDTTPACGNIYSIATVADVRACARLIGLQIVRADDALFSKGDESRLGYIDPEFVGGAMCLP